MGDSRQKSKALEMKPAMNKLKSAIQKAEKTIATNICKIDLMEKSHEETKQNLKELQKRTENKLVDAKAFEIVNVEEVLTQQKRCQKILLNLMPPEGHGTQETETGKDKVLTNTDGLKTGVELGLDTVLPSTTPSSGHSDTLVTNSNLDSVSTENENKLELYLSDPQRLAVLMSELTDQILYLMMQNFSMRDRTLEQTIETTLKKMTDDEEMLTLQLNETKEKIDKETERIDVLKKKVRLHDAGPQDQNIMLEELDKKITDIYCHMMEESPLFLDPLEKLSSIEYRMSLLFEQLDNLPEEILRKVRHLKENEKMQRLQDEQQKIEMEKQGERLKKCILRSHGESKKITGRKLMPRCTPLKSTLRGDEIHISTQEDLYPDLFIDSD
ncbi:cilia- and flagella-associated protein 100-like [Brachyistius frenatus]|uniref:cilia- and flagella-associated protein 100-like n=1 Tax=Brachyistius frenatus TaxID=100188 RepID=UPI0037E840B1